MAFVVVSLTYQTTSTNNLKLRAMNAFTFTNNQIAALGNKLNIITVTANGYYLESVEGKMITTQMSGSKVKFYKTLVKRENLIQRYWMIQEMKSVLKGEI